MPQHLEGYPQCLRQGEGGSGDILGPCKFHLKALRSLEEGAKEGGKGLLFPLCSSMIPECWLGRRCLLPGPGGPSWEVQARWVLSTQPQGWAGARGRHGAGWPAEAAAAVSGVHSGSVHGTRSWWGRPGSWARHCMGAAGPADCAQGLEWSGRRCPRGRVTVVSCRPWSRCCWGYAPGAPPHSCRAS